MKINKKPEDIQITGLQKLTLLDYPERTAAILFLPGCNLRCPFCHNSELIHTKQPTIDYKNIEQYLIKRKNMLDGIVITGGEPSLQDITPLLKQIKNLGYQIKIDTNGLKPKQIQSWTEQRLVDYIAMDIKNSPTKYPTTCGCQQINMSDIYESIHLIMNANIEYEFRTTVVNPLHQPEDFTDIGTMLIPNAEKFYIQPFVMRDSVPDKTLQEPSDEMLMQCLTNIQPYVKQVEIRGKSL